jgi:hypothetical protein
MKLTFSLQFEAAGCPDESAVASRFANLRPRRGARRMAGAIFSFAWVAVAVAVDPTTNSWLTAYDGIYARIYTNDAMQAAGTVLTTWSNGSETQAAPAYCGIQAVYFSSDWVYVRSTGLASYSMGPWSNGAFPNLPTNQKLLYRLPRTNGVPAVKTATGGGMIGIFVDGVEQFNSWDAYYWNGTADTSGAGTGYWNRDAYVNEGPTFDPGNAHQQNTGVYHYHASPVALRYLLGDHVDYDPATKTYVESAGMPARHSPILGWVADGFPIYGPYGYSVSNDAGSGIRRMVSGYVLRTGAYGTSNLTAYGRTTIPQWAVRLFNVSSSQAGPAVSTSYPLGRYMEDNDFLGDHGIAPGTNTYDLDEYNGRYCVTPEFPHGTYAYFVAIASNGTPVFPYNIGRGYYGSPAGGSVSSITETVATNFIGGPDAAPALQTPTVHNGLVALVWSAAEGGTYEVQSTTNFSAWVTNAGGIAAQLNLASCTNLLAGRAQFYRVARTALAAYDPVTNSTTSGSQTIALSPSSGLAGTSFAVSATISASATPTVPPHTGAPVQTFTIGGNTVIGMSYTYNADGAGTVVGTVTNLLGSGSQTVTITFSPPAGQSQGPTYTQAQGFTVNP